MKHFAGRSRVGTVYEEVVAKQGLRHFRQNPATGETREVLCIGAACSEIYSGPRLARIMEPALELQREAIENLARGEPARCMSQHTSAGVTLGPLETFIGALGPHLPWNQAQPKGEACGDESDWFVSLQTEGASAVWAACDLLLQAQHPDNASLLASGRRKVGVGARSYHGPGATSFGSAAPLGRAMKPMQVTYPVPSALPSSATEEHSSSSGVQMGGSSGRNDAIPPQRSGEPREAFVARATAALDGFLAAHAHEVGVLLVEPQWGSSLAAQPWPPEVLSHFVSAAQRKYGMLVCADEIMCGLARHGQLLASKPSPADAPVSPPVVSTFLSGSAAMDFVPDAVTFGKAIAGGQGDLLAGVALRRGAAQFHDSGRSALQVHTYAASSARALLTAAAVLDELPKVAPRVAALGEATLAPHLARLQSESRGAVRTHGQGLMWGGLFAHKDRDVRRAAAARLARHCDALGVAPYLVPEGGFMVTPIYDADRGDLEIAMGKLVDAALLACADMGWGTVPPPPIWDPEGKKLTA